MDRLDKVFVALAVTALAVIGAVGATMLASEATSDAWPRSVASPPNPPTLDYVKLIEPPPHELVMRSEDGGEVRILHRDGWTRRETSAQGYTHIGVTGPRGYSYGISFTSEGAPTGLSLARVEIATPDNWRFARTDTLLGERCDVRASTPTVEERVYGGPVLACVTDDGITLWQGRAPPWADDIVIHARALRIERRDVAWSEVLPPRELLAWSAWSQHFPLPPEAQVPAFEIRFGNSVRRQRGELTYRGGLREGSFSLRNVNAQFTYSVRGDDYALILIETGPQTPWPHPLAGGSEVMERSPVPILGETCRWHRIDLAVRWGIVSTCVTRDGIALANATDFHDASRADERSMATYFHRGAPPAELMLPSATLFEPWLTALPD